MLQPREVIIMKSKHKKNKSKNNKNQCKMVHPKLHHCFHFIDQCGRFVNSRFCC